MVKRRTHLEKLAVPVYGVEDLPISEIRRHTGQDRIAKLSFNENPYGAPPAVRTALEAACMEIARYGDPHYRELYEALATYTGKEVENIIVGNGADELIDLACRAFVGPGEEVLLPLPIFGTYLVDPELSGANVRMLPPTEDLSIDLEALKAAIRPETKIVALCNPNNPTGRIIPSEEISAWLRSLPKHVLVIIDEAYGEYVNDPDFYSAWEDLAEVPNLLVIRTFSKVFGLAGIRLGYGVASPEILAPMNVCRKIANVNSFASVAGVIALKETAFAQEVKEKNRQEREKLTRELSKLGFDVLPSQTNFLMVKIGPDAKALWESLNAEGIWVRFGGGWNLPEYLRISLGTPEENEWLLETIQKWHRAQK